MSRSFIDVAGVRTALDIRGSGPPLLLLHGLGCSGAYFRPLQAQLTACFTIYTPDMPGHGRSAKPRAAMYTLRELTDWVAQLIRQVAPQPLLVAGHSLGGGVAVDLAARYPELVRCLVLLAPTGVPEMPPLVTQLPLLLADGVREPRRLFPRIVPAYLAAGPRRILRLAIDQQRYAARQYLHTVRQPMLVMRGSEDPIVPQSAIDDLQAECGDAEIQLVPGAAHALQFSHPAVVAAAIKRFAAT
jgi:pimeloyl-ACP methyl ester carboxylesterase